MPEEVKGLHGLIGTRPREGIAWPVGAQVMAVNVLANHV
jgi:hypothetical protein